jgi:hypothetical protein
MLDSGAESGKHIVPNTQKTETCDGRWRLFGTQHEIEHLYDIMKALEVAQNWVSSQHCDDDVRQFLFPPIQLFIAFYISGVTTVYVPSGDFGIPFG